MQIVKINEEYIELIKKTKDISNNISAIKKELASVRLNLDKVYDGRVDFDTRLRNAEKKLTNQASKMKTLSDVIESTIGDIMQIDNVQPQINVESGNPAGVIQMPSLQESLKHWSNFKERYSTSRWKEIFDSAWHVVGGITGWTTIIPTVQDTAQKVWDGAFYPAINRLERVKKMDSLETVVQIKDRCTTYAVVNLLRRKQVWDGKDATITAEEVRKYNYHDGGYYWETKCCGYTMKYANRSSVNKTKGDLSYSEYIQRLLDERPEGIVLYTQHDYGPHAVTITNYEIIDGKIQFFVMDSKNAGNKLKLEDTALYSQYKSSITAEEIFSKMHNLYYVK